MNKICFIFLTTTLDSYERFKKIKECGVNNIDFYYLIDISVEKRTDIPNDSNVITMDGNSVWKKYNTIFEKYGKKPYVGNPQFSVIEFWKEHREYDYFWFCEDDIFMKNGDYSNFFKEMEEIESDLLLTHYNNEEQFPLSDWCWYSYVHPHNIMKYPLHYYVQMFRLSNLGCKTIDENFKNEDNIHSECAIPSIIYMRGLSTKFINLESKYKFKVSYLPIPQRVYDRNTFYHPLKCVAEEIEKPKISINYYKMT